MHFQKVDSQYHSVRREAERAAKWAEAFGLQVDEFDSSSTGASYYGRISNDDESFELRVSRHEPNYSRASDADIMIYVGASIINGNHDTKAWRAYAVKLAELSRQCEWPACVKAFFTRRDNQLKEREAAKLRYEAAEQARIATQRQQSIERFIRRCADHRINRAKAVELLSETNQSPCGLAAQLRKWLRDSGLADIPAALARLEA